MTGVTETSRESYRLMQTVKGERQQQVLAVFQKYRLLRFTDRELARILRWPINRVTPRRGELVKAGVLVEAGLVFDGETKRRVQAWRLKK